MQNTKLARITAMNKFFLFCLLSLSITNYTQACVQKDTIPIVKNIQELINSDSKKVVFRTNNIRFQFVNRHLDTSDSQTRNILDSISNFLMSNDVDDVEIDIHLSLAEWDETYSQSLLLYMYEDIISYLANSGVDTSYIIGKQCYNYNPLINCNALPEKERKICFINEDSKQNRRVEFIITKH